MCPEVCPEVCLEVCPEDSPAANRSCDCRVLRTAACVAYPPPQIDARMCTANTLARVNSQARSVLKANLLQTGRPCLRLRARCLGFNLLQTSRLHVVQENIVYRARGQLEKHLQLLGNE